MEKSALRFYTLHSRCQVKRLATPYLRGEAELRGDGRDCLEPVRRRVNPPTPHRAMAAKGRLVSSAALCHVAEMEIVFSITQEADGGFVAECLSQDIFTQGDTWDELRANVQEAVTAYFFDQPKPTAIRLHLVRDEVLAVA